MATWSLNFVDTCCRGYIPSGIPPNHFPNSNHTTHDVLSYMWHVTIMSYSFFHDSHINTIYLYCSSNLFHTPSTHNFIHQSFLSTIMKHKHHKLHQTYMTSSSTVCYLHTIINIHEQNANGQHLHIFSNTQSDTVSNPFHPNWCNPHHSFQNETQILHTNQFLHAI